MKRIRRRRQPSLNVDIHRHAPLFRFDISEENGQFHNSMRMILKASLRISLLIFVLFQNHCLQAQDKEAVAAWKKNNKNAEAALAKEDFTKAKECYEAALTQAEKFPTNDARLSETLTKLASVRMNIDEVTGAELDIRRALAIDESRFGSNDLHLAPELLCIGQCCAFARRCDEADDYFKRAQAILEKAFGKYDRTVGLCIWGRANDALVDERYSESETLFKQAIELIESSRVRAKFDINRYPSMATMAPNRTQVARIHGDQGLLFVREKKYAEAESNFKHSIELLEHDYGKHSRMLCTDLVNLAQSCLEAGKLKEANEADNRALALLRGVDPESPVYQRAFAISEQIKKQKP